MYSYFHRCYLGNYWVDATILGWDPVSIEIWCPCEKNYVTISGISSDELKFKRIEDHIDD
jgi:hypothetical protein